MISFLITVCDEHFELKLLLNQISYIKKEDDEVIIIYDENKITPQVREVIDESKHKSFAFNFKGDFSEYKNFGNSKCTKEWIFQLDADERLSDFLAYNIHNFVKEAHDVELVSFPRINIVKGITEEHVTSWGWVLGRDENFSDTETINIESKEYFLLKSNKYIISEQDTDSEKEKIVRYYCPIINYPDRQGRLYKNSSNLKWEGKVHEKIVGWKNYGEAPIDNGFDILHFKDIVRQEKQNSYYGILENNRE